MAYNFGRWSHPPSYLQVSGNVQDTYNISHPSIEGKLSGVLEINLPQKVLATFHASGTMSPAENDVMWNIVEVEIPSFEYAFTDVKDYDETAWSQHYKSHNDSTYPQLRGSADEGHTNIHGFEINVIANNRDPLTWVWYVNALSTY